MKRLLCVAVALTISSCASRFQRVEISPQISDAAKVAVLSTLKDPSSAQFGDKFAASSEGRLIRVCGTVNAKNGFGGYTGPQVFSTVYNPQTGEAIYEPNGGDSTFACALFNASGYSTAPPSSVLAQHGIIGGKPSNEPSK